jgi:hypothetical protein
MKIVSAEATEASDLLLRGVRMLPRRSSVRRDRAVMLKHAGLTRRSRAIPAETGQRVQVARQLAKSWKGAAARKSRSVDT